MIVHALRGASAIALVRGRDVDVNVWRRRLDRLEYPSVEFESLESFFSTVESGRNFSAAFIPASEVKGGLDKISIDEIQILLIVNDDKWNNAMIRDGRNSNLRNLHYISSNATELEWGFRTELLFGIVNQPNMSRGFLLKSQVESNFCYKQYEVSIFDKRVFCKGCDTFLKPREYEVAVLLFLNVGCVLPRYWLLKLVWGETGADSRALDVCISRLREKLCLRSQNIVLRSVYRKGYQLIDAGEADEHHHSLDKIVSGKWGRA